MPSSYTCDTAGFVFAGTTEDSFEVSCTGLGTWEPDTVPPCVRESKGTFEFEIPKKTSIRSIVGIHILLHEFGVKFGAIFLS